MHSHPNQQTDVLVGREREREAKEEEQEGEWSCSSSEEGERRDGVEAELPVSFVEQQHF